MDEPTYRHTVDGECIDGAILPAFIKNGDVYSFKNICIYSDGLIEGWPWSLVDLDTFAEQARSGSVVTQPPEGVQIRIGLLGSFTATDASFWIEPEEFICEVADEIEGLNGRPMARERCFAAWTIYEESPSDDARETLRIAYEAVPAHKRRFVLGDMDLKDHPIRDVPAIFSGRSYR